MAAPCIVDDISTYLTGTLLLSNVSAYEFSSAPVNQYFVAEYPGLTNLKVHGGSTTLAAIAFDETMIQIGSRHTNKRTAKDNLRTIVDALDGLSDTVISGTTYTYITQISPVRLHTNYEDGSSAFIAEFRVQARRT